MMQANERMRSGWQPAEMCKRHHGSHQLLLGVDNLTVAAMPHVYHASNVHGIAKPNQLVLDGVG